MLGSPGNDCFLKNSCKSESGKENTKIQNQQFKQQSQIRYEKSKLNKKGTNRGGNNNDR